VKRSRLKPMSDKRRAENRARAPIREAVFRRDNYRCRLADRSDIAGPCFGVLTPHHLLKASAGGAYVEANLVALCAGHNSWVECEPILATGLGLVFR
jgi:hypothetical protein